MNKDRHEDFLEHIKNKESYSKPFFYIGDLLNDSGVGNYKQICTDRIADAYLIDSVHVTIDLFGNRPGEILVDGVGIRKCESILKSYVTDEKFNDYLEYIDLLSLSSNLKNDQLALLQSYTEDELKNLIDESNKTDEDLGDIQKEFVIELESRKPFRVIKGKGSRISRLKKEIKHQALSRKYRKMVQSSISSVSEELMK